MPESVLPKESPLLSRVVLGGLLVLIGLIWAVRNLPWHVDDFDQAKQAFVSFEMLKTGHWWFQHTPLGHVATKPPLAGWIAAGLRLGLRFPWELSWRLPSIVAAAVLLWALARAGGRIGGRTGVCLAVSAFALNLMTPRLATLVRTDMLLALFISLVGVRIYFKLCDGTPWSAAERWQIFALFLGSMLTKGPIAYAFLLPGVLAFAWIERRQPQPVGPWSGVWSWFGPLIPFGIWTGLGIWLEPGFYEQVVQHEFLGRFTVGEQAVHHNQPVYFYLTHLLRDFLPWSAVLLVFAFFPAARARVRRDPALLWLVCWALGGLVFMSLVPSKRGDRIFPVIPPLALLVGALWEARPWAGRKISPEAGALVLAGVALLFSGGATALVVAHSYQVHNGALAAFGKRVRAFTPSDRLRVTVCKDEGMLLYLDRLQFTKKWEALALWKNNGVDVLILPKDAKRPDDAVAAFETETAPEKNEGYVCLVRPPQGSGRAAVSGP